MRFFRKLLFRIFAIEYNFHQIFMRQKALKTQLDFLLKMTNRKIRKKWRRILTRKTSPFYIGDIMGR
jgi:ABC-type anion transport system duplicated permease subunit